MLSLSAERLLQSNNCTIKANTFKKVSQNPDNPFPPQGSRLINFLRSSPLIGASGFPLCHFFLYKTLFTKFRFKKLKIETVFPLVLNRIKLYCSSKVLAIFDLGWKNIHIESCSAIKKRSFLSRQFSLWFQLRLSLRSLQHAYMSV